MGRMPFYTVTAPKNSITADQKRALAKAITRVHADVTGAPESFVHVTFLNPSSDDWFSGGEPGQGFRVDGQIRAGRSDADKQRLLRELSKVSVDITGFDASRVDASLTDIPAKFITEGGRIAPEPGQEQAWFDEQAAG
jgi:phenylpyruvate tautomerase PptA (4-oxalocrotonate tautomerase family)